MIEKPAQKFIKRLDKVDKERILRAIAKLPDGDTKALQGHKGYYRLRVGSYRIIYTIHNGEYINPRIFLDYISSVKSGTYANRNI